MLESVTTRRQEQLEHLAQVHALSQAVRSAISAIEKNDLRQFETHLAAQETICNRLSGIKWTLSSTVVDETAPGENPDAQLQQEIRQAYIALAQLNRVYAALLKRARRSVGLIAALYRSHGEGYNRGSSPLSQRHSLSCEG
jgi:hypothetical protein